MHSNIRFQVACVVRLKLTLSGSLLAISAAFFVPLLFNGILNIFPPNRRGTAMGVITMMFTAAPALGHTLSGIIIDHTHWRVIKPHSKSSD